MHLQIDTSSRTPIYRQLTHQIREAIARGKLEPGEKLPSVRELSRCVVVNPNTIARVYTELEREGVVNTRPGLGAFVARPKDDLTRKARKDKLLDELDEFLTAAVHLGFEEQEVQDFVYERMKQFRWDRDVA